MFSHLILLLGLAWANPVEDSFDLCNDQMEIDLNNRFTHVDTGIRMWTPVQTTILLPDTRYIEFEYEFDPATNEPISGKIFSYPVLVTHIVSDTRRSTRRVFRNLVRRYGDPRSQYGEFIWRTPEGSHIVVSDASYFEEDGWAVSFICMR